VQFADERIVVDDEQAQARESWAAVGIRIVE
jgi:hypothetical protein